MTLPGDLSSVVVQGTYQDVAGDPQTGSVSFTPCAPLMDATGRVVVTTEPVTCELDGNGEFTSPPLAATDNTTLLPAGWFYKVAVTVSGGTTRFSCFLPSSPSTVDITALTPLATLPQVTPYITGEGGTIGGLLTLAGSPPVRFPGGAAGDVLTSDVFGNGSWAPAPVSGVSSVNSQTGAVELSAADVGADAAGAASTAQSTAEGFATSAVATETSRATTAEALLAPKASPALTGSPTAPTQTTGDNTTKIATDQFVTTAVAAETTRAETAEALALPLAGGTMSGNIAMGSSHKVTGLATGSASGDAVAFQQLPSSSNLLPVTSGGTGSSTQNFVDLATTQSSIGGAKTFTGATTFSSFPTLPSSPPSNPTDAANKSYVDSFAAGLNVQAAAAAATVGSESYTYTISGGTVTAISGVVIDAQTLSSGLLVLVKDAPASTGTGSAGSSEPGNGLYVVTSTSGGNLAVSRATGMSGGNTPVAAFVFVEGGTHNGGDGFVVTTPAAGAWTSYGSGNIQWTQFSSSTSVTADGTTLSEVSGVISLTVPVTVARGGTNAITQQGAINNLAGAVTSGDYLRGNGTNVSMSALAAGDLTGTVAIANGGTGAGGAAAAITALTGTQTSGKYLRSDGTNATLSSLAAADLTGTVPAATLPAATTLAQGAIELGGGTTNFLRADGTWAAPAGGASLDTTSADIAASPVAGATGAAGTGSFAAISTHAHPSPTAFAPLGLTGATQASRYVGSTTTGLPASGTFVQGDWGISRNDGNLWVCLTGGLVGSGAVFTQIGGSSAAPLPLAQGGTQATSAAAAITNLGAADLSSAQTLTAKTLKNTSLTFDNLGSVTTAQSLSTGNGNVQEFTLGASVAITAITGPGGSNACDLTLYIKQATSGGPFTITSWPGSVTWLGGSAPTIQQGSGAVTVITFESLNGGTAWFGAQITGAPSLPLTIALGGTGATDSNDALAALAGQGVLSIFGNGNDGAVVFDGTTTFTGFATLSGTTYTLTRDVMATSITVNNTVTVRTSSGASGTFRIFCQGTVTVLTGGTITAAGNPASGATAGAVLAAGSLVGGRAGGAGGAAGTGPGVTGTSASFGVAGGAGGTGTAGAVAGGAGGTVSVSGTNAVTNVFNTPFPVLIGFTAYGGFPVQIGFGAGGGGGGGATGNAGGGGGGGGGIVAIFAYSVVNSGTITVAGGAGGAAVGGNAGGGGGGSGGLIIAYTLAGWTAGVTTVTGGNAGAKAGTGTAGAAGGAGNAVNVVLTS